MPEETNPNSDHGGSFPGYFHRCRAGALDSSRGISECLTTNPGKCPYCHSLDWSSPAICNHPNRKAIVGQTVIEHPEKTVFPCSFCDSPKTGPIKVIGKLLRYACDECFVSRCMICGILCLNPNGHFLLGVKHDRHQALYCKSCSSVPRREHLVDIG